MANPFPFGAEPDTDSGSSRKALLLVLGGVLVLALVGYFVVLPALSGGADEAGPVAVTVTKPTPKKPAKKPAAKPAAKPAQPAIYRDSAARDPFKALWYKPVEQPVGPQPVVPVPGSTVPPATGGTGGTGGGSATVGGQRVALIDVFTRDGKTYAQTRVGSTVYTPAVGETFATSYKLLATGSGTATYLFGDEQFTLYEGQEVLK